MLSENKIDKKVKEYINEHLSKGYSKQAVKEVLINHGYDALYVNNSLRRHSELQFLKKSAIIASLLLIISIFAFNIIPLKNQPQKITAYAAAQSNKGEGCCTSICQQASKNECYGKFAQGKNCIELEDCNVGCCIDKEGYCLVNYLYGNCMNGNATYINKDCKDIIFCTNITDKSYKSRLYNIKNKKGIGILAIEPIAGYYKSYFNIKYYPYDRTDINSVIAEINDNEKIIDSIALYDDGSHNDGVKNDNIFANNWQSSKISAFEGFKKLDVEVATNIKKSIVVLNNNKCLPIYNEWNQNKKYNIIFAADNYKNFSDGYYRFESDVNNFLSILFSIDKFIENRENFNIYRLEQSLSYFNLQTLLSVISNSCPSYSSKDLVVILDNNEDYCKFESARVVRVNPQVTLYKNTTNAEINEVFSNFCDYAITAKEFADDILAPITPPKIVVHTLTNITYNVSAVNLLFSISALNYPINYSLFVDNSLTLNKISNEEITESIVLNLKNGTNAVLIIGTDKNRNSAFSQVLLNVTIK